MRQFYLISSVLIFFVTQVNSQNYKFGKVSKEEVQQKEHPIKKNANAAVLFRSQNVYYTFDKNNGFSLITEIQERIKIYNKGGFDWATKEIRKYNGKSDEDDLIGLKGYTYNLVDGKLEEEKLKKDEIFEEEKSKYWTVNKFTMPAVTEGSVIEYTYKIKSPYIGSIGKLPLQYTIPIDRLEVDVRIPEYFYFSKYQNLRSPVKFRLEESSRRDSYTYSTVNRGENPYVVKHNTRSNKIEYRTNTYTINKNNIPALKEESHVENLHTYAAFIDWELQYTKFPNSTIENYSQTWEGVTKSIYNDLGIGQELKRDGFYDEEVDQLLIGSTSPREKANKILAFVKQKVKWNNYVGFHPDNGTKKAFKEGSGNTGDINLLLISILKYANLDAHPVLVSTPSNGIPLFPTRDGFNYIVAGLNLDGNLFLIDATDPNAGIGELPKRARNWQGRLIKEGGDSEWINLMPNYISENSIRMNIKFEGSTAIGRNYRNYKGLFAKEFREEHATQEQNNNIKERLETVPDIEITDYEVENKNILGAEIIEKFDFKIPAAADVIGDKIYLKPLLYEGIQENPFKEEKRSYPLYFDFPEVKNYAINIMLPDGYKVVSLPESTILKLGEDDGEFKFIVNSSKNIIRLSSHLLIKKTGYLPEEYDFLKKFYTDIIKKHSEAIVLEKTIENGNSERAESGR